MKVESPRLFVDVTTSLMLAGEPPIGISRVEGELARRLLDSTKFKTVPVIFRSDGFLLALSPEQVGRIFGSGTTQEYCSEGTLAQVSEVAEVSEVHRPPLVKTRSRLYVKVRLRATSLLRRIARKVIVALPLSVREDVRAILIHSRQIARTTFYRPPTDTLLREQISLPVQRDQFVSELREQISLPLQRDQFVSELRAVVHPRKGDIFWTAGLYSNFVPLRTLGELREKTGLKVATTFYDLIRVTHPQFNPASMQADLFAADVIAMLDSSDLIFAISNWSRSQLLAYAKHASRAAPETVAIRLGCDFTKRGCNSGLSSLPYNLTRREFALTVGTIEPRKNYALLLSIWAKLCEDKTFKMDLVIVGKPGFESDSSLAQITNSPLYNSRIHWVRNCADAILLKLYESCQVFVYPSLVEGWGLPVTEALAFGCPVIAADRGAIPEAVGQGLAQLLDPSDEASWIDAIASAARKPRGRAILENPPTWDAAAASVSGHLWRLAGSGGRM